MSLGVALRPRNATATRASILAAARRRFAAEGFDDVGVRDIARDAGVDAALVSRYFGGKDELFLEALDACGDCPAVDGPRDTAGARMAHELVHGGADAGDMTGLQIMLRSVGSARASELIRDFVRHRFSGPLTTWIGGPDAAVRCALVGSMMMGVAMNRDLGGCADLSADCKAALEARLAKALQAFIDD